MFKAGTLLLNMYRTSTYPKNKVSDKVSLSPNTVEEKTVQNTSAYLKNKVSFSSNTVEEETVTSVTTFTTVTPSTSHEAIEDDHVIEEAEVEEKEEYDTDSDAEYPIAGNDEEDCFDDLVFLRAVTT